MNIYLEVMKSLVEIVRQGGVLGLWGLAIYLVLNLVRLGVILLVVFNLGKLLLQTISTIITVKHINKQEVLTLLPKKCSKDLQTVTNKFAEDMKQAVTSFTKEAKDLLKESKDSKKK